MDGNLSYLDNKESSGKSVKYMYDTELPVTVVLGPPGDEMIFKAYDLLETDSELFFKQVTLPIIVRLPTLTDNAVFTLTYEQSLYFVLSHENLASPSLDIMDLGEDGKLTGEDSINGAILKVMYNKLINTWHVCVISEY